MTRTRFVRNADTGFLKAALAGFFAGGPKLGVASSRTGGNVARKNGTRICHSSRH
jgi:hypothetical protein